MATSRDFPAVLFDFNGVLVDDEHVHLAAFRDALRPMGIDVSDEEYATRYLGFDDVGAFRSILEDAGRRPSADEIRALVEAKKPLYLERASKQLTTFAGAAEVIRTRAAVGPVGIVSGALLQEIELGLEVLGVRSLVSFIVPAEAVQVCKPDPEGYLLGIEQLTRVLSAEQARQALVVEDSLAGIQSARLAGLHCVAVAHSYEPRELEGAGATWIVQQLSELTPAKLEQCWAELKS
jgi:beta-phosphoglucomutase